MYIFLATVIGWYLVIFSLLMFFKYEYVRKNQFKVNLLAAVLLSVGLYVLYKIYGHE